MTWNFQRQPELKSKLIQLDCDIFTMQIKCNIKVRHPVGLSKKYENKQGVTNTGNGERGTGNGESETGVWERVHSGNPYKNSKWPTKTRKKGLGTSFEHALFEFDRRSKQHG